MLFLLIILIFATSYLWTYSVLSLIFIRPKRIDRLRKYFNPHDFEEYKNIKKNTKKAEIQLRSLLSELGKKLSETMALKKHQKNIQSELIKAGIPLKGEEFLGLQTLCLFIAAILTYYTTKSMLISFVFAVCGWIVPSLMIKLRKKKRYKLFSEQLGDAITLISNSLKAGYSFLQAVDSVATEMPSPISDEFKKLLRELRLGADTEEALNNLYKRVQIDDLELLITAVIIQREIGGNLSEILDNISGTIRERIKLKGEIKTLTAQGRISGLIISLLPIGLGVVLYAINPEYMMILFKSQIGLFIIGLSVMNQIIGMIVIKKIINIEV